MFSRILALCAAILFALVVTLPVHAQVKLTDQKFQNKPVEPGANIGMAAGAPAALGDGIIIFKFELRDVDPIADDASDVAIECILIQNLGTATGTVTGDILEVMVLDEDGNSIAVGPTVAAGAAPPGGCTSFAATAPNAQVAFEVFFDISAGTFDIPDDGPEIFQVAVRTNTSALLTDDAQNHTLHLRAQLQLVETVGSPPVATPFVENVTDTAPEVVWNGGINKYTQDTWVVNPLMPGETGTVSRFTVCDHDSNAHQLIIDRLAVKQDENGTANSSDIVSLDLYRVEGFTRTLVASRTPDATFDRGSGAPGGLLITGGAATAITVPDDQCMTFELDAQISQFAFKTHTIQPRFQLSTEEPAAAVIDQTVDPEIKTPIATMIGKGSLVFPDTKLVGKPGIIPIQVSGVALPGLGTLQVGPNGKLQFDPNVIRIDRIVGVAPYIVDATEINNRAGVARFTVRIDPNFDADGDGAPDNVLLTGAQNGTIAQMYVTPTGAPGMRSRMVVTFDCFELVDQNNCIPTGSPFLNTPNQNPNNDISVVGGEIEILYPGDVDFDGTPTIRDALLVANALLACLEGTQSQSNTFGTAVQNVTWSTSSSINVAVATNNLTKDLGGTAFNAGAVSTQMLIAGDGYVESTVAETNTDRLFGLSRGNDGQGASDIDFAVFLRSNGELEIRRNGTTIVPSPTINYATGDVIRIEINGNDMLLKRNGSIFLTLENAVSASNYPFQVDTSIEDLNATIQNVQVASLGNNVFGVIGDLSDEQKTTADVAAPFADVGEYADCTNLTSRDVAEIARLAINFGTTPAPASAASVSAIDKPWYSFLNDMWSWVTGANQTDTATLALNFNSLNETYEVSISDVPGLSVAGIQGRVFFDPMSMEVTGVRGLNGYNVMAFDVDNALGEIRFLAMASQNQGVYEGNLLSITANTIQAGSTPSLQVEALIDKAALDIPFVTEMVETKVAAPVTLSMNKAQALAQNDGSYVFRALGTGISEIELQIYDLAGGKIFEQQNAGNTLTFQGLSNDGQLMANGVYLYVITAKGFNSETIRSTVNKLAILR